MFRSLTTLRVAQTGATAPHEPVLVFRLIFEILRSKTNVVVMVGPEILVLVDFLFS